jgi:amino acid transporter
MTEQIQQTDETYPTERTPHPWAAHLHERHRDNDLRRGALNAVEVFGQSIGAAGPSIAIAGTLPFAYAAAGVGSVGSVVIGTVIVLLIAVVVARFAREHAATGSLYTYAAQGLGPWAGFTSGWALALGYTGIASACGVGTSLFVSAFLDEIGISHGSTPVVVVLLLLALAAAAWVTVRGVKLSTHVAIVLEIVSLLAIFAVFAVALAHFGFGVDTTVAARTASPTFGNVSAGAVIAVTIFVGFESAGSLGAEAANPYRAIPRAIFVTAAVAGLLYLIAALVLLVSLSSGAVDTSASVTPINAIASAAGAGWLSPVVDLGIAVSAFACTVASFTGAARSLFTLSREGALPTALGKAHRVHATPHVAVLAVAVIALVLPVLYLVAGWGGNDTVPRLWAAYLAAAVGGTYGYLLAYVLVAISALVHDGRRRALTLSVGAAAVLAIVAVAYVVWGVFGSYAKALPEGFAVLLVLGLAWFAVLHRTDPERARRVGTFTQVRRPVPVGADSPSTTVEAGAGAEAEGEIRP